MFKILLLLIGAAVGGVGVAGWLLSAPDAAGTEPRTTDANGLQRRIRIARERFDDARAEGKRSQDETRKQLEQKLNTFRSRA